MQVMNAMTLNPVTVQETETILEAARKMEAHNIGMLPVMRGTLVVGVITDRDITVAATSHGWVPIRTQVQKIMSPRVIFCSEEQDIDEAAELMAKNQIRRLVVYNRHGQFSGVLSLGDLATRQENPHLTAETLRFISRPMPAVARVA